METVEYRAAWEALVHDNKTRPFCGGSPQKAGEGLQCRNIVCNIYRIWFTIADWNTRSSERYDDYVHFETYAEEE